MAAIKTRAVVLRTIPYRESSCIAYLLTENEGLVHTIAKGVRRAKNTSSHFERGFLVETVIHMTPGRDMFTISGIGVLNFYPKTRAHLIRSALRDAAFEMVLGAVTSTDPHPELFTLVTNYLAVLEQRRGDESNPYLLWRFYRSFAAELGFALNTRQCGQCGENLSSSAVYVDIPRGISLCTSCRPPEAENRLLSLPVVEYLNSGGATIPDNLRNLSRAAIDSTTDIMVAFCRYHFDLGRELKSVEFLKDL